MGGDKEEAQLDVLSHFEHKCEERERAREAEQWGMTDSTRGDFFFFLFILPAGAF